MNIGRLHEILGDLIAEGRGDDQVFVTLISDKIGPRTQEILDDENWEVYEVSAPTDAQTQPGAGFVVLNSAPEDDHAHD